MLHAGRITTVVAVLALTACTWIKPSPEGEAVRVLGADDVGACQKLGDTTVSLLHKVAGINRSAEKVRKELETMARNSAATMGGDAVVATSPVNEGEQSFDVYECTTTYP